MRDVERTRLAELETVIERGLASFMDVGTALLEIRDDRLYKLAGHRSFEDYTKNRWPQMSRTNADRLIKAASVSAELAPIGVSFKAESQARELAPLAPEERVVVVQRFAEEDRDISTATAREIHAVAVEVRQATVAAEMPAAVSTPTGKYRCIVIDPPWPIQKIAREERPNQVAIDYPTMTLDDIAGLPVGDLAERDGCHVYLWTTHKFLPASFGILEAWGARYQCLMTWVKNVGFTPFSWMYSTEHVLFGRVGSLDVERKGLRLDFAAKVREHSRKPDEFYELVRQASPGPRLELFAREGRDGFDLWGNETGRF